jgi:hypothetical protein
MLLAELCIKHNLLPTDEYLEALELMEFVQINRGNDMTDKTVQATPELPVSQQLLNLVEAQAQDGGLWFEAKTAPEAYLQQELRKLHAAIEARAIQAMPELPELPVVAWLTGAGILTSNFFYKESWIPKPVDQPLCKVSDALTYAESLRVKFEAARAAKVFYPSIDAKVARLVREIDALLFHVERGEIELAHKKLTYIESILRAELSAAQAEPVYVQVRHKTEYGMSEWGVPLDPKEQHSTWADGVEMRLLYTTPPSTSHQKVARLEKSHELARRLLTVATWAAGKIIVERKRGASTAPHAEVDALVCANESIRSWLITTGWSGCIESAPTLEEIAAIASTKPGATP